MQNYQNIKDNTVASICVWSKKFPFKAYKLNGRVKIHKDDKSSIEMDRHIHTSHQEKGLIMPINHPIFKPRKEKIVTVVFIDK